MTTVRHQGGIHRALAYILELDDRVFVLLAEDLHRIAIAVVGVTSTKDSVGKRDATATDNSKGNFNGVNADQVDQRPGSVGSAHDYQHCNRNCNYNRIQTTPVRFMCTGHLLFAPFSTDQLNIQLISTVVEVSVAV